MLEPQERGLIDLPDYEHVEDETFPPFPPPASPGREDGEGAEPDEGLYRAPKKVSTFSYPSVSLEMMHFINGASIICAILTLGIFHQSRGGERLFLCLQREQLKGTYPSWMLRGTFTISLKLYFSLHPFFFLNFFSYKLLVG